MTALTDTTALAALRDALTATGHDFTITGSGCTENADGTISRSSARAQIFGGTMDEAAQATLRDALPDGTVTFAQPVGPRNRLFKVSEVVALNIHA